MAVSRERSTVAHNSVTDDTQIGLGGFVSDAPFVHSDELSWRLTFDMSGNWKRAKHAGSWELAPL